MKKKKVACSNNPNNSLKEMFVDTVQQGRIAKGQCPALRPVFLKPHGVAHGRFKIRNKIPAGLKVGLFAGSEYPLWARFSSDTQPTSNDFKSTLGIGLKLFDTPTPKIFGAPQDTTFDFILQNMDVFFVDTAKDMCEFTKAGVIDGDYGPYLKKHPKTAKLLDEMAKPVGSCLASPYWSGLPFALGPEQAVKYKLEPTIKDKPPRNSPVDPTYLAADLAERLARDGVSFKFMVQLRTDPKKMPLDKATVPWPEEKSPYVHVADVVFPKQDIRARGQAEYGENLSYNIWRVTEDHRPLGSIAEARRVVYAASAELRRNVNGVPDGEPAQARPELSEPPCADKVIVRAAIHPGIGVTRVGNADAAFYIGPEVTDPAPRDARFYRDKSDALKREAARFRIYGYNAAGEVVRELTADNASIEWTAHLANRKADWFRFITAMDIPETRDLSLIRRNATVKGEARQQLIVDPGPRSISGVSQAGSKAYAFDSGKFKKQTVYLGELQTDEAGRLLVLGGRGRSESPGGKPPFDPADPDSFNNADDWFDDVADGPVDAEVSINGRPIPVEGAWVVVAPPNYAPDIVGWRTLYDLLVDVYVGCGWLPVPEETSFSRDVLPQLRRFSSLQWVNKGFYTMFGRGMPMDFEDPDFIARLNRKPVDGNDPYQELRRQLLNAFRPHAPAVNEPRIWPWIYGDDFGGSLFGDSTNTMLALPAVQQLHLQRWADGDFIDDWQPGQTQPGTLAEVPLQQQPAMLDRAALHFCLADAFHPGCEMTWPMRHATLYQAPFRIRRRATGQAETDYGPTLDQATVLSPRGPLHGQRPGDITRWMGLPWQGDTAYCRSGYDPDFDLYLPTFWPARVPNNVLTREDYEIVIDKKRPREERIAAYARRASWYRFIDQAPDIPKRMERMIAHFGAQGVVEAMPGVKNDPLFPETIYVESLPAKTHKALKSALALAAVPADREMARLQGTVWGDAEHLRAAQALRARRRIDE